MALSVRSTTSRSMSHRVNSSLFWASGSGKTTLLGLLGGFIQPSSGSIHFGDRDVTLEPPHKRNIGVVFQNYALFPHMSVGENVAFPLRARRLPKASWPEKVRSALAMVGLAGYQERGVAQLSGGQRQRVALARAMIFEPRLITDGRAAFRARQAATGIRCKSSCANSTDALAPPSSYVTHDQREAPHHERPCRHSERRAPGPDRPARAPARSSGGFLRGQLHWRGEPAARPAASTPAASRWVPAILRSARIIPNGDVLILAVHSEKLLIDDGAGDAARQPSDGTVTDVVYQGESLRIFLVLPDGTTLSLRQPSHHEAYRRIPPLAAASP